MQFRVLYKEDLTKQAGVDSARRWAVNLMAEPDEFMPTLNRLMADASSAGQEITSVIIERPVAQAA